jgi:hypothetical protein
VAFICCRHFDELIGRSLLLAVLFSEAEIANKMVSEGSLVIINNDVVAIYPHQPMIMQDQTAMISQ